MYYLKNTNFWMFGLFFFFYFFIMGAYFPFFPIWLHDINHISKSDTGIIFAAISLFSLLFQPLFGLLSDKLGLRKYLLWIITGMLVMFAPFFIFIFGPLLQYNILVGSMFDTRFRYVELTRALWRHQVHRRPSEPRTTAPSPVACAAETAV